MAEQIFAWLQVHSWVELMWLAVGLGGQALFMSRFIVQWGASERAGRSVMPEAFWYLSISGGIILFIYGIHRREPVLILGQSVGIFVYLRNIWLIHAEKRRV
ncbi:lipid-A-disaccharide synthase N-terminal domain-containing protein [Fertoebacter nigrum]|uniref:Lipid-A-disaccharide synthase N-terminal domain-containing protein n=1 Tax=Fertoeibacter niger TaxID=2656921 RepID=A0A8X8KLP6_9RHOB|nr:lipid-A-disaccharide synthase N-terminal domain-containing protein [Fertoeibacter niger]NUB43070.1 lipid-A-disaccharide synthase N-terminal domain-containing protein [Fertoeibacter niger]